jgi:hypothetical protein
MSATPPPRMTATRFFGGLLMAAGGLIAVSAGLCSVIFSIMGLRESGLSKELFTVGVPLVLVVGGVPIAIGLALFFVGRMLYREPPTGGQTGPS